MTTHNPSFWNHVERLGTPHPFDQDTAWRQIAHRHNLFAACKEQVAEDAADSLACAWEALQRPGIAAFLTTHYCCSAGSAHAVEVARLVRSLRGFVAAARAAHAVQWPARDPQRRDHDLLRWVHEAARQWGGTEPTVGLVEPLSEFEQLIADRFDTGSRKWLDNVVPTRLLDFHFKDLARRRPDQWRVGAARDCVHALLGEGRREARQRAMHVLTYRTEGRVLRLVVELLDDGTGECYPDPLHLGLHPATPSFLGAAETAWTAARREVDEDRRRDHDVRWRVAADVPLNVLDGGSMGAALAVAFTQLLRDHPVGADAAVTAELLDGGLLGPVEHVYAKARAAFAKGLRSIAVHPENAGEARRAATDAGLHKPGEAVHEVRNLAEAIRATSGLVTDLSAYYDALIQAPQQEKEEPAPLYGGRSLASLYVRPDFVRLKRQSEQPNRAKEGRTPSTPARPAGGLLDLDLDEDTLFAADQQGEPATWDQAWREWRTERARIIVKGAPGQGKSVLTQMLARDVAEEGRKLFTQNKALPCLEEMPRPIMVRLNLLLAQGLPEGKAAYTVFRQRLGAALAEQAGCSRDLARHLAERAHEGHTWLILDALDEVSVDSRTLAAFFRLLNQPEWCCRVLITTRPYGFDERSVRLDRVALFRLGALSPGQQKELTDRWFQRDAPPPGRQVAVSGTCERVERLLRDSPPVRLMAQNAFLLSLLCGIAEEGEIPAEVTRTQLYERVLVRILDGTSRAAAWDAGLRELARRLFLHDERNLLIHEDRLLDFLRDHSTRPPLETSPAREPSDQEKALDLFRELLRKRLLVRVGMGRAVMFSHRTFAEFLMARALAARVEEQGWQAARLPGNEGVDRHVSDLVDHKAWRPAWHEVLVFLGGMLSRPRPLVELVMDEAKDDDFLHRLALASRLLAEIRREVRESLTDLVDSVTTRHFSAWWSRSRNNTLAVIPQLAATLPALASLNGRLSGTEVLSGGRPLLFRISELLEHGEFDVRFAAARALGGLGSAAASPAILARLGDLLAADDSDVRYAAAHAVGGLGSAAASPAILARLGDLLAADDLGVRYAAAHAVGGLGSAAASPAILARLGDLLADENSDVRSVAAGAVGGLGSAAASPAILARLGDLLADENSDVRSAAAGAVGGLGSAAASPAFLARLDDLLAAHDLRVRSAAAGAVGGLGSAAASPAFLAHLGDLLAAHDSYVRYAAAGAVGGLGSAAASPAILARLGDLLADDNSYVRYAAAGAVGGLGSAAASPAFLARLGDLLTAHDLGVWYAAAGAVGGLGSAAASPAILARLGDLLADDNSYVRSAAANAVGGLGSAAASPAILARLGDLLADHDSDVRSAAAGAVGRLGSAAASPAFLARLGDLLAAHDLGVRYAAAHAVGGLGSAAASPAILARLGDLLADENSDVRSAAAGAVGRLGSAAASPAILARLSDLLADENSEVRSAAAGAVGGLGSVAASPAFLARLSDLLAADDSDVRSAAAYAVGGLGSAAASPAILARLGDLLADENRGVRSAAANAVGGLGSAAASPAILARLGDLLAHGNPAVRRSAAEVVGALQTKDPGLRFWGMAGRRVQKPKRGPLKLSISELGE